MRDYSTRFNGRLEVSGHPRWSYEGLFAYLDPSGLSLPRLESSAPQIMNSGPHITIACLSPVVFINAIYYSRTSTLTFSQSGDYVGSIQSYGGHVCADLGTGTYPLRDVKVCFMFHSLRTEILITGSCGAALPWTFQGVSPPQDKPQLDAFFVVPDSDLQTFLDSEVSVTAFKRNRSLCV